MAKWVCLWKAYHSSCLKTMPYNLIRFKGQETCLFNFTILDVITYLRHIKNSSPFGNWKVMGSKFRSLGENILLGSFWDMMLFLPSKWEVAVVVVESHRDGFLHDMVSYDVSVEVLGDPLRRGWNPRPPLCPRQLHGFVRLYQSSLC